MKTLIVALVVMSTAALAHSRMTHTRFECISDDCFVPAVQNCADNLVLVQSKRRALKVAMRRCSRQIVRQCRRFGHMPTCDDTQAPPDSVGGAFPTTTTTLPPPPPSPSDSSFVGEYKFVGKVTYDSCGQYPYFEGSYIPIPFVIQVQSGDYLIGTFGKVEYDGSGFIGDTQWSYGAQQCDLQNDCCFEQEVITDNGALPAAASFKFHYECKDHTECETEAEGNTYNLPGTQGPYPPTAPHR